MALAFQLLAAFGWQEVVYYIEEDLVLQTDFYWFTLVWIPVAKEDLSSFHF